MVITLASKLSGTYQSAVIAAQDYENIYVVDSESAAIGGGILVELALQCLDAGMSAQEIAAKLGISVNSAKVIFHRAKKIIKEILLNE